MLIFTLAKECSRLLTGWLACYAGEPDESQAASLLDHLYRFNVWSTSNCALSEEKDSLDRRLRQASLPHTVIIDLLDDLRSAAKEGIDQHCKPPRIEDEYLSSVKVSELLDQLIRFSTAIRRAGLSRKFVKRANFLDEDEIALSAKFRESIVSFLGLSPRLKETSQNLKDRLLETICLRQQNFASIRSEMKKRVTPAKDARNDNSESIASSIAKPRLGTSYSVISQVTSQRKAAREPAGSSIAYKPTNQSSIRTATTFYVTKIPTTDLVVEADKWMPENLPRPIKTPFEAREFECPYCYLVCPVDEFTKANWDRHIIHDLAPFICVLENCPTPNNMYSSITSWTSHMRAEHACYGWTCISQMHPLYIFYSKDEFKDHMFTKHNEEFLPKELDTIAQECYGCLPTPTSEVLSQCPFCDEFREPDPRPTLEKHVAEHLLSFAQFSLSGHDIAIDLECNSETDVRGSRTTEGANASELLDSLSSGLKEDPYPDSEQADGLSTDIEEPPPSQDETWDHYFEASPRPIYDPGEDPIIKRIQCRKIEEAKVTDRTEELIMNDYCLCDQIYDKLIVNIHRQYFLPKGDFDGLMTQGNIKLELSRSGCLEGLDPENIIELVNFILSQARKCFATLVFIEKIHEIKTFYQNGLTDKYLPVTFSFPIGANGPGKCVAESLNKVYGQPGTSPVESSFAYPSLWNRNKLQLFQGKQWLFLAPVFKEACWKYVFPDECPLPFLTPEGTPTNQVVKETLFSLVHQTFIHFDHIDGLDRDPRNQQHHLVAIKELKPAIDIGKIQLPSRDPVVEAQTLEKMRDLRHRHVIRAIATFEWRGNHHFIFPWADNGNLREFWEKWDGIGEIPWVLEQIEGLCDALEKLHAKEWWHGDLKPENILCFRDGASSQNLLVMADVGFAKAHGVLTAHRRRPSWAMGDTWMYCPPEPKGSPRSRLYDIWSMGAIILEIIICLLYGHNQLDILYTEIQRYYVYGGIEDGGSTARIHPEVERWIGHIYRDPRCGTESNPTAMRRLLKLVHERLLIVHVRHETMGGDTQSLILQSDVLEVRLEAPAEDISPHGPSTSNLPSIEVEGESAENMSSVSRADSNELLQAIHAIRESCNNAALPYFIQLRPDQSYARPHPRHEIL
ncbi:hypothetical protein BDZ45DRAFT_754949 [Acephala macrosclerotiorum]|nr:hypothetical protein BDZ45DRAFT_754949 [Acephala macrosclerotiorum]